MTSKSMRNSAAMGGRSPMAADGPLPEGSRTESSPACHIHSEKTLPLAANWESADKGHIEAERENLKSRPVGRKQLVDG